MLCLIWSETPKTGFLTTWLKWVREIQEQGQNLTLLQYELSEKLTRDFHLFLISLTFSTIPKLTPVERDLKRIGNNWSLIWRKPTFCYHKSCISACALDQPMHLICLVLISAFVLCYLDSIMPLISVSQISSIMLAFLAQEAGFNLPGSNSSNF